MTAKSIPENLSSLAQPGVIISNCWPQSRSTPGATLAAIKEVLAGYPFFEAYQTVDIPTSAERREVRRILGDQGHPHTYTLTRVLAEANASLSSLDPANRRLACEICVAQMAHAVECGANTLTVISGPRPPEPERRAEALAALEESLVTLCEAAAKSHPGLIVMIEPLDYEAHKRNTLGKNGEAVAIAARLKARGLRLDLCVDTAHLILNREKVPEAVAEARSHMSEFHFVNAVLDTAHPLFGDRHLPFGAPGVVDVSVIAELMVGFYRTGFFSTSTRPRIYCEVWKPDNMESLAVVAHGQEALQQGWAHARQVLLR